MLTNTALPLPNVEAETQSQQLLTMICDEIHTRGPITFARYMELALYAPELGYYRSGLKKFGAEGDFITAPELSPLFSQCIAKQCQQVLSHINETNINEAVIIELGPGSGAMAAAIVTELAAQQCLPQQYYLLELSAELRQRQQHYLKQQVPELYPLFHWLDGLPKTPRAGIILANEVVDAIPVHKFAWQSGQLYEYYVTCTDKQLCWHLGPPSSEALKQQVAALNLELHSPYNSEINLILPAWISSLSQLLSQGLILLIDYGFPSHEYYHPQRNQGTIMCHYQHFAHDNPLILPGIQDITAHVDFTAIANAAVANQLEIAGFTHQAGFLLNCGIAELFPIQLSMTTRYTIAQQIKRLTLPSEMGELFKVIALTKNYTQPLLGFSEFNRNI